LTAAVVRCPAKGVGEDKISGEIDAIFAPAA
jgi:hypothetical protein